MTNLSKELEVIEAIEHPGIYAGMLRDFIIKLEAEIIRAEKIIDTLQDNKSTLQFEPHNFKINSKSWKKITVNGEEYKVNPKKDIWEFLEGEFKGEQLFTWNAAMRETKKQASECRPMRNLRNF